MEAFDSNLTNNSSVPFNYQFTNNGVVYYTDSNGCWYTTNALNPYSGGLFDVNTASNVASDYACQPKEPTEAEVAALSNNSYLDLDGQSGQFEVDTSSNVAVDSAFLHMPPLQQAHDNQITSSPTAVAKAKRTSYAALITKAINSSAEKRMTLLEIYDWMVANVVEFKDLHTASWKSSIRHCLSFHHKRFKQWYDDTTKSSWWTLAEEVDSELVKLLRKPTTRPKVNAIKSAIIPRAQTMTSSVIFPPTETTMTMHAINLNHSPQPMMTDQPLISAQSMDQVLDEGQMTGQLFLQEGSQAAITLDRAFEYADTNFVWYQDGVGGFAVKEPETEAASPMNYSHPNPHGLTGQFEVDTSSNVATDGAFPPMTPLQPAPDNQITATNFYHKPTGHGKHPTYSELITKAINSSPEKRLTLSEIYDWMVANVVEFKDQPCSSSNGGWKNSIRHNLSLHKHFKRVKHNGTEKFWWTITDQVDGDRIKIQTRSTTRPQGKTVTSATTMTSSVIFPPTETTTSTCAMNLNHSPQPMMTDQPLVSAQSMDQVPDQGQMTGQLFLQEGSQAAITLDRALEYANSMGGKTSIALVITIEDDKEHLNRQCSVTNLVSSRPENMIGGRQMCDHSNNGAISRGGQSQQ